MLRRNVDLWLIVALAAAGIVFQLAQIPPLARAVFGLPLALFCPGYALMCALFPARPAGWPERTLLILGLSLAVAILGAVGLNASPWGLGAGVWAGLFACVTAAASLVAAVRRRARPEIVVHSGPGLALAWPQLLLLGAAGLLTIGAVSLARTPRPATKVLGYTLLWLLPDAQNANTVRVGLSSSELTVTQYRLRLTLNGGLTQGELDITLAPGEKWERLVNLPAGPATGNLEAVLYRLNVPNAGDVYRRVTLARAP